MIISCPACDTRYNLTPEQIGAEGRMVRCKKCGHNWHQPPETQEEKPPLPPENPHTGEAPPTSEGPNKKRLIMLSVAALLLLGTAGFLAFKFMPQSSPTPQSAQQPATSKAANTPRTASGLQIENVERRLIEEPDLNIMVFTGTVTNTNTETTPVPEVRVFLLNEKGIEIDFWPANVEKNSLKPGESTSWTCRFFNPPLDQVAEFKVVFGK